MRRTAASIAVVLAILLVGFGAWYYLDSATTFLETPQPITIGVPPNEQSALVFIADDQQLFAKNGLKATLKMYDSALAALDGLASQEVEFAQSAEYPIVGRALQKASISVIGSIDRHSTVNLVGRKDRGIENVSDLKGKKIGVPRGTITDYYLGKFLTRHGVSLQDVTLANMPFTQSADALANGSVDAFQVRNRDVGPIAQRLGGSVVIWPSQGDQAAYEVLSARTDWIASHPEAVKRLLKAIVQAEEYAISHPAEAKASVQSRLKYDDAYMEVIGPQHQYSLSLDQSLILAMEGEARWMIDNDLTREKQVPNFLERIYLAGLEAVRPGAVNVIR